MGKNLEGARRPWSSHLSPRRFRLFGIVAALLSAQFLAACVEISSRELLQLGSVVNETKVDFAELYTFADRSKTAYASESDIHSKYPATIRIGAPGETDVRYFLEQDDKARTQYVSVRGTIDKKNFSEDIEIKLREDDGIPVHAGFDLAARAIYDDIKPLLKPGYKTYLTGHSLGGAIAALLAVYIIEDGHTVERVVTFGQPRFTTAAGVERIGSLPIMRVVDENDMVPMLPPATERHRIYGPYEQIGPEIILLDGPRYVFLPSHDANRIAIGEFWRSIRIADLADHKIDNYLERLSSKRQGAIEVAYKSAGAIRRSKIAGDRAQLIIAMVTREMTNSRLQVFLQAIVVVWSACLLPPSSATAGTLNEVRARDHLICGVSEGLRGFSDRDGAGAWRGFDVDFCRALAAAVFGDPDKIEYRPYSATARFDALKSGEIDVLSRNSTWTMSRDLELGIEFAGIAYYDGQGFLAKAVDEISSALELSGARICVVSGTTTEENAKAYFARKGMDVTFVRFTERGEAREAYASGKCDVYTADRSALASERSLLPVPDDHVILPEIISKEPLGPVTREGDAAWTGLVRWTLYGLINAEEEEITSASVAAPEKREVAVALGAAAARALGLQNDWLAAVIAATGNYGEIFDRNLGEDTPLGIPRGINALWTKGGILYAPPMQ